MRREPERRLRLRGELPFNSDGERRRERITRSRAATGEALPLDRLWKAEQIGGGKAISRHLWSFKSAGVWDVDDLSNESLQCSLSWKPVIVPNLV